MDKSSEAINQNKGLYLEESLKKDTLNERSFSFEGKSEEEKQFILKSKPDAEQNPSKPYYVEIMSSHLSLYHILNSIIMVLAILTIDFQIFQIAYMFKLNLLIGKLEIIIFIFLTFLSICGAYLFKGYLFPNLNKTVILISAIIDILLVIFITATRSAYILFLCYPFTSFLLGLIYFNAQEMFDDYFGFNKITWKRNLFYSLTRFGIFLVLLLVWLCSKDYFTLWYLVLIVQGIFVVSIAVLTYFSETSPYRLFKEKKSENQVIALLEKIKGNSAEVLIKKNIIQELHDLELLDKLEVTYPQGHEDEKWSDDINLLKFNATTFCMAYINIGMIFGLPTWLNENFPQGQNKMDYYFQMNAIILSIAVTGGLIGTLCVWLLQNFKRTILIMIHFIIISVFLLVMILVKSIFPYMGAIAFMLIFSLKIILDNSIPNIFTDFMKPWVTKTQQYAFFMHSAICVLLFEALYIAGSTYAFSSTLVFALCGSVLSILIKENKINNH
jgi:hypothetical protein